MACLQATDDDDHNMTITIFRSDSLDHLSVVVVRDVVISILFFLHIIVHIANHCSMQQQQFRTVENWIIQNKFH